jgi:hypothetical protein
MEQNLHGTLHQIGDLIRYSQYCAFTYLPYQIE